MALAAGIVAVGTSISAQAPAAAQVDASKITGGNYTMDPAHTLIGWRVNHFGINDYFGLFGLPTGTLVLDPANPSAAKLEVTIPVTKVTTANPALTAHLLRAPAEGKAPDFFGPTPADAKYVSTSVTVNGQQATIVGNLTLNGQTHPVTLHATLAGAGSNPMSKKEEVGFHATGELNRSDFGVAYAVPMVSDRVGLEITAAFEK